MNAIRATKGVLLFIAFTAIAYVLMTSSTSSAVVRKLEEVGVSRTGWVIAFFVSAIGNLYIGLRGHSWNAMLFAPFFVYVVTAWIVYPAVPETPLILYTLLGGFLIIDLVQDLRATWKMDRSLYL